MTEEQIAEINAQTVDAGDWVLISMQAFTSEESLTVTMKNGETFVVKVTDAQISTHVITADGKNYIITVTYGPEAGIPDGEVYFTIGDKNGTSTVYALWYGPGKDGQNANRWHAMDASYFARWKAEQTEGVDFTNRDLVLSNNADNIALHKNDSNNNSANSTNPKSDLRYTIYTANDEFFDGIENNQIYDMSDGHDLDDLIQYNDDDTVTINGFNMGNRLYYLESSIASSVKDMQTIAANYPLGSVYVALETFAKSVQHTYDYEKIGGYQEDMDAANITYDENYEEIFNELTDIRGADGTNQLGALSDIDMFGTYDDGGFSGGFINNSETNKNIAASKKYVVLITDGAPNAENSNDNKISNIHAAAEKLKANGINVITIGLSIEDVEVAPELLWWAASGENTTDPAPTNYVSDYRPSDSDEPRLFYWAQNGEDLTYILREIVRTVMKEATINATITDKIDKLFICKYLPYLVAAQPYATALLYVNNSHLCSALLLPGTRRL